MTNYSELVKAAIRKAHEDAAAAAQAAKNEIKAFAATKLGGDSPTQACKYYDYQYLLCYQDVLEECRSLPKPSSYSAWF